MEKTGIFVSLEEVDIFNLPEKWKNTFAVKVNVLKEKIETLERNRWHCICCGTINDTDHCDSCKEGKETSPDNIKLEELKSSLEWFNKDGN